MRAWSRSRRPTPGTPGCRQGEAALFQWTTVPQTAEGMREYVAAALRAGAEGSARHSSTVRRGDGVVVGSTRFFMTRALGLAARVTPTPRAQAPDGCEIGYTWLNSCAIRTAVNTEAKYLMLRHAFEQLEVHGVCFHTDARNARSREALGGSARSSRASCVLTGCLPTSGPRDSARYSHPPVRMGRGARAAAGSPGRALQVAPACAFPRAQGRTGPARVRLTRTPRGDVMLRSLTF